MADSTGESRNMKIRKENTILIPWESYLYLQNKQYEERMGKPKPESAIKRLELNFENCSHNGLYRIGDGALGGCIGTPENAWEEKRWTSWSCEDMKQILDSAGLPYKDGGEREYISI